jgi:hypothetical protein
MMVNLSAILTNSNQVKRETPTTERQGLIFLSDLTAFFSA